MNENHQPAEGTKTPQGNPKSEPRAGVSPPPSPRENKQEKKRWCEKYRHEIEAVAVAAAVFYAIFTYREWHTFDSERQIMQGEQLAAEKAQRLEQQPWIVITSPSIIPPFSTNHFGMEVFLFNTGRTPALIQSVDFVTQFSTAGSTTNLPLIMHGHSENFTVAPSERSPCIVDCPTNWADAEGFKAVTEGRLRMCPTVMVTYRDIFGSIHHSTNGYILMNPEDILTNGGFVQAFGPSGMD